MNEQIVNGVGSFLYVRNQAYNDKNFWRIKSTFKNGEHNICLCINSDGNERELLVSQGCMVISKDKYDSFLNSNSEWKDAVSLEGDVMKIDPEKVPLSESGFAAIYNGTMVISSEKMEELNRKIDEFPTN